MAHYELGNYDLAMADFDKALQLNPQHMRVYAYLGRAYLRRGDHDRAIINSDKAVQISPRNLLAHIERGVAYLGKGEYDRAIADFDRALQIDPRIPRARIFVVLVLAAFLVTTGAFIWAVRWIYFGIKAHQFVKQADDLHNLVYTIKTVSGRRQAKQEFETLVEAAVRSKNGYINNRDTAEMLEGFISFAVEMAVADEQPDAEAARIWGERVKEKLQPMFYKPRIKRHGKEPKALAE